MMYARVSLPSVREFKSSVQDAGEYSNKFAKGIAGVDDIKKKLGSQINRIDESIVSLAEAHAKLKYKIKCLQAEMAEYIIEINVLNSQLALLEADLIATPRIIMFTDNDGKLTNIPNPRYENLQKEIGNLQAQVCDVEKNKKECQKRLNKAELVAGRMLAHIESGQGMAAAIKEKQKECDRLHCELEDISFQNLKKSRTTDELLSRIEKIIKSYQGIKLRYSEFGRQESNIKSNKSIDISLNINQNIQHNEQVIVQPESLKKSEAEKIIKQHGIKHDESGRICIYDGKRFGGQFNSYDKRLKQTPSPNDPIMGHFEGERGESKYIPSNRNAKGIVVIEILELYGLDGINYINAEPDFEVCSEAVVKIREMSANRYNFCNVDGISSLGNFVQADIECAKLWNKQKKEGKDNWNAIDVRSYREIHGLTWHEKCDTETMVLVRWEINDYFKHSGGCSECFIRDSAMTGGIFDE